MKTIVCGSRTGEPAYFDLTGRFHTGRQTGFFRIGDRAAGYVFCLEWRRKKPDRRLVVIDIPDGFNEHMHIFVGRECPAEWVFGDLADEVWLLDSHDEPIDPPGEALLTVPIWEWWYHFNRRQGNVGLQTDVRPPAAAMQRVEALKAEWRLPPIYATLQPLCDAPYAFYRNRSPAFWEALIARLSPELPLVVIGHPPSFANISCHPYAYCAWTRGLNVLESLAMISGATMHVGGETGTTIWSSLMRVNTYGVYACVHYEDSLWFAQPLDFGGQVRMNLGYDDDLTPDDVLGWWRYLTCPTTS